MRGGAADGADGDSVAETGSVDAGAFTPPAPYGWTDALTDTDGPRLWDRILATEQARNARHRRTSTVALFEVDGIDSASTRIGPALGLQLFIQLSRALAASVRKSDYLARIGPARFGVLLTETDEISAINFVDRVKDQCAAAVDPSAGLRVIAGWASPEVGGRLTDAVDVAEMRLADARRNEG